jgi:hypothetical protein
MNDEQSKDDLIARCRVEEDALAEVRGVLRTALVRAGFDDVRMPEQLQNARLLRDPDDRSTSLVGEWRDQRGAAIGSVVIYENGDLFGELDVQRPHPRDRSRLLQTVVTFGRPGQLQTELRFAPRKTALVEIDS